MYQAGTVKYYIRSITNSLQAFRICYIAFQDLRAKLAKGRSVYTGKRYTTHTVSFTKQDLD
jgi:hypothetical protein